MEKLKYAQTIFHILVINSSKIQFQIVCKILSISNSKTVIVPIIVTRRRYQRLNKQFSGETKEAKRWGEIVGRTLWTNRVHQSESGALVSLRVIQWRQRLGSTPSRYWVALRWQIAHKARSGWNNKRRVKKKILETLFYLEIYSRPVERAKNMDAIKMHIPSFKFPLKRCHIYIYVYVSCISWRIYYILIFIVIFILGLNLLLKEFKRISW